MLREMATLSPLPILLQNGERAGVRGGHLRRRWSMPPPLPPTLSP